MPCARRRLEGLGRSTPAKDAEQSKRANEQLSLSLRTNRGPLPLALSPSLSFSAITRMYCTSRCVHLQLGCFPYEGRRAFSLSLLHLFATGMDKRAHECCVCARTYSYGLGTKGTLMRYLQNVGGSLGWIGPPGCTRELLRVPVWISPHSALNPAHPTACACPIDVDSCTYIDCMLLAIAAESSSE